MILGDLGRGRQAAAASATAGARPARELGNRRGQARAVVDDLDRNRRAPLFSLVKGFVDHVPGTPSLA